MNYKRLELDLTNARTEEKVELGGSFTSFLIVKAEADFEFKINSKTSDTLYSSELQGFEGDGVFHTLYVTNTESAGKKAVLVVY